LHILELAIKYLNH